MKVIHGKVANQSVAMLHTGVGRKSCESKIDNFLRAQRPRILISSGFAGGAREDLQVGDLILSENFSDRQLLLQAQRILTEHKTHTAKLFTSATIIDSIVERNKIAREHGAAAMDMETECIAQACVARGIRMLSLRVISDTPRKPFPAPPRALFDIERQRTNVTRLALYFLKHPMAVGRLIRFARQIARARESLTNAIVAVAAAL